MTSVFGGTGFIGSRYVELFGGTVIPRAEHKATYNDDVLYLISTTDNYNVFKDVHIDINTNLNHLMSVLSANAGKIGTFNFISSWFVYGDCGGIARESSICQPKGFYSITKHCAEQLLVSYCRTMKIPYRIIRLCNVYGPKDKFSSQKNALQFLIDRMKKKEKIALYNGGEFIRNYMHVDDVCSAINLICTKGRKDQIYNVASDDNLRFRDIIDFVAGEVDYTLPIENMEPTDFHKTVQVRNIQICNDRLKDLGFVPKYQDWKEGIRTIC